MFESFFESSLISASITVFLNAFTMRFASDPITVIDVRSFISDTMLHNTFAFDDRFANATFVDGSIRQYQTSVLIICLSSLEISFVIAAIGKDAFAFALRESFLPWSLIVRLIMCDEICLVLIVVVAIVRVLNCVKNDLHSLVRAS